MIIGYAWTSDRTLKPCPFCGKKNTFCTIESTNIVNVAKKPVIDAVIHCHNCGCTVHYLDADKDFAALSAKTMWNYRAGDKE